MAFSIQAAQRPCRRPKYAANDPAASEETKLPNVTKEVINCWTVVYSRLAMKPTADLSSYIDTISQPAGGILIPKDFEKAGHGLAPVSSQIIPTWRD